MVKLLRRLAAGAAAALAMHPATQAAPPTEPVVEVDQDSEARSIAEHPMEAVGVRKQYLSAYVGATTQIDEGLLTAIRSSRKWRNSTVDAMSARAELDKFIEERTR